MNDFNNRPPFPGGADDFDYPDQPTEQRPAYSNDYDEPARPSNFSEPPMPAGPSYDVYVDDRRGGKKGSGVKGFLGGLLGGLVGALAVALVLNLTPLGSMLSGVNKTTTAATQSTSAQITTENGEVTITPSESDTTLANAVATKTLPSVVSVYVTTSEGSGMGSGVIIDKEGNIITNYHVAGGAESLSVTLDGKSYDATLVGTDQSSDLAVIHADFGDTEITPMERGDSSALSVGDWVMTVGSPFGLDQSVSSGIVSSLYRSTMMEGTTGNTIYANLIQVDANINPGNSGGALVNSQGQLVGISTLYTSSTESFAGIGFAIDGNYALRVADALIAGQPVEHAYIGLSMATVNASNARSNNLSVNQGAYIVEVVAGGPAEAAGLQKGDVITAIDGDEISSADGVILSVRSHTPGDAIEVTYVRGTEQATTTVTLGSDEGNDVAGQGNQQQQQQIQQQVPTDQREQYYTYDYYDLLEQLFGNPYGDMMNQR